MTRLEQAVTLAIWLIGAFLLMKLNAWVHNEYFTMFLGAAGTFYFLALWPIGVWVEQFNRAEG